jgi:hypothetical protein
LLEALCLESNCDPNPWLSSPADCGNSKNSGRRSRCQPIEKRVDKSLRHSRANSALAVNATSPNIKWHITLFALRTRTVASAVAFLQQTVDPLAGAAFPESLRLGGGHGPQNWRTWPQPGF